MCELDELIKLVGLGYRLFPLGPGGKKPLKQTNGCKDATSDPDKIRFWFNQNPQRNWGLATDGLLVIDKDGKDNPWPGGELNRDLISSGVIASTPKGGIHYFFKQPADREYRNTVGVLAEKVDTRANGGYVVLAGSETVAGPDTVVGKYEWLDDCELTVPPDQLPEPPQWLLNQLVEKPKRGTADSGDPGKIPDGKRNDTLFKYGRKLREDGHSQKEILAMLLAMNQERCVPPLDQYEVEKIASQAAKYEDLSDEAMLLSNKPKPEPELDDDPSARLLPPIMEFPYEVIEYARDGHIMGPMMDFIKAREFKPQPIFSFASSLMWMALLAGRKIRTTCNSRTNLFILNIAGTNQGKDACQSALIDIDDLTKPNTNWPSLTHNGFSHSATGVLVALRERGVLCNVVDEVGRYLSSLVETRNQNSAERSLITAMLRLYSSAKSRYNNELYADTKNCPNDDIIQPHWCFFGGGTPEKLFEGFSGANLSDGLLSRFLLFKGLEDQDIVEPLSSEPPPRLVEESLKWRTWFPGNQKEDLWLLNPRVATWNFSQRALTAISNATLNWDVIRRLTTQAGIIEGVLFGRAAELTKRVTLILAANRLGPCEEGEITDTDWNMAAKVVDYSIRLMANMAARCIGDNPFARLLKKVRSRIYDGGPTGVNKRDLIRSLCVPPREMHEVLRDLIDHWGVIEDKSKTGGKGRPSVFLKDSRHLNSFRQKQ